MSVNVSVADQFGVPIVSAHTAVPWLARLPYPLRTVVRRWRSPITMVVGVGIALALGMTMLG